MPAQETTGIESPGPRMDSGERCPRTIQPGGSCLLQKAFLSCPAALALALGSCVHACRKPSAERGSPPGGSDPAWDRLCSEQAQSKCPGYSVELLSLCMRQPVPAPLCTSVPLHRAPLGWSSPQFHDLISFPHTPSKHETPKGLPFHHPQKTEQKLSFS